MDNVFALMELRRSVRQYKQEPLRDEDRAALLAPTAVNRQGFMLEGTGDQVTLTGSGGVFTSMDRGIVKYHFEQGAGVENFRWSEV